MKIPTRMSIVSIVLAAAALACSVNLGGPEAPEESVPVSTEAVKTLVEAWEQAFESAKESGSLSLTLTEEQLTSFLVLKIAGEENPLLSNPQIDLRDGEMEISGVYTADLVSANVSIVMEVAIDENGMPVIEVTSGAVGPLPVPPELLEGVSVVINQALTGEASATATGFKMESITITEGALTITGTLD